MDINSDNSFINYAKTYAYAALKRELGEKATICQIDYILSNLSYWRGEEARETKKIMREIKQDLIRKEIKNGKY